MISFIVWNQRKEKRTALSVLTEHLYFQTALKTIFSLMSAGKIREEELYKVLQTIYCCLFAAESFKVNFYVD